MSSIWGEKIKLSIFGESHGSGIGVVLDGLPAGEKIDMDEIIFQMGRRAPGKDKTSTQRKELDIPEIISGYYNGHTTGTPLTAIIKNNDMHSGDYSDLNSIPRPGHADFTGAIKYNGFNDYRGGGHFWQANCSNGVCRCCLQANSFTQGHRERCSHIFNCKYFR